MIVFIKAIFSFSVHVNCVFLSVHFFLQYFIFFNAFDLLDRGYLL